MKDIVEYIVKCLVKDKDSVQVRESEENGETILYVTVSDDDMGRVIGRKGKIASSIRAIVKSISSRDNKKVFVKFGDNEWLKSLK